MDFNFTYCQEPERVIPAVEISARASNPQIAGKIGTVIKAYTDNIVKMVGGDSLLYKIESIKGNLAGYVILDVSVPVIKQLTLRPAYVQFSNDVVTQVNLFIINGNWKFDKA